MSETDLHRLADRLGRSPFFLRRLREAALSPWDLQRPADLEAFPQLSRGDLVEHPFDALGLRAPDELDGAVWAWSKGSTGPPLAVVRTRADLDARWALHRRIAAAHGVDPDELRRGAFLCALPSRPEYRTWADGARTVPVERISLLREGALERLAAARPDFWSLSPAGLRRLLASPRHLRPRIVFSTALWLSPDLRVAASAALGCPIANVYSMAETGPLAFECPSTAGAFHVLTPEIHLELAQGRLLVTRLTDALLPLLRYRIEDQVSALVEACACGYRGATLVGLAGRSSFPVQRAAWPISDKIPARSAGDTSYQGRSGGGRPEASSAEISSK